MPNNTWSCSTSLWKNRRRDSMRWASAAGQLPARMRLSSPRCDHVACVDYECVQRAFGLLPCASCSLHIAHFLNNIMVMHPSIMHPRPLIVPSSPSQASYAYLACCDESLVVDSWAAVSRQLVACQHAMPPCIHISITYRHQASPCMHMQCADDFYIYINK